MPKGSSFDKLARDAASNIMAAKAAGEQLGFLPDEAAPVAAGKRAPRGKGKITSQLREWCAVQGLRMPEDVLAEMAGMTSDVDAFETAMRRTEQLLAWAQAGAVGYKAAPVAPSTAQRLATFQFVFTAQLRALEAQMAYHLPKVTPDVAPQLVVPVVVASPVQAAVPAGTMARDVTPQDRRLGPPNTPEKMQAYQALRQSSTPAPDDEGRTQ